MNSHPPASNWLWRCRNRELDLSRQARIMGILNVTPDSFSDGGQFLDAGASLDHALEMLEEGAEIIDVGGESTRPGARTVEIEEEKRRVLPVIEKLRAEAPGCFISIDTRKYEVARAALEAGADIVNDVSGLRGDPRMPGLIAETGAGAVIMHMLGEPGTMQKSPRYENVVREVREFFREQLDTALAAGMQSEQIVFDPGIGFGKSLDHNLALLRALPKLSAGSRPLMLGVSRKSMFKKLLGLELGDRLPATVTMTALGRQMGVRLHRVHDVGENLQALRVTEALLES